MNVVQQFLIAHKTHSLYIFSNPKKTTLYFSGLKKPKENSIMLSQSFTYSLAFHSFPNVLTTISNPTSH